MQETSQSTQHAIILHGHLSSKSLLEMRSLTQSALCLFNNFLQVSHLFAFFFFLQFRKFNLQLQQTYNYLLHKTALPFLCLQCTSFEHQKVQINLTQLKINFVNLVKDQKNKFLFALLKYVLQPAIIASFYFCHFRLKSPKHFSHFYKNNKFKIQLSFTSLLSLLNHSLRDQNLRAQSMCTVNIALQRKVKVLFSFLFSS